jgi:hypothetical protein
MKCAVSLSIALAAASITTSQALAAPQPVVVGPYPVLRTAIYDIDYAISNPDPAGSTQPRDASETIVSIGLPSGASSVAAVCQAQVDWFDWDNTPAGLSGPGFLAAGGPVNLVPGQTLEFTTSTNSVNPLEYPPFTENIFRDITVPVNSVKKFEGRAEVRILCPAGVVPPKTLRVDAEVVKVETTAAGLLSFTYKPINVTKTSGLVGY